MSLESFARAQRLNAERLRRIPHYADLIVSLDAVYTRCLHVVQAGEEAIFGKSLLLCHRTFLSASTLAYQGQPEDASTIMRRGVEIAKFCLVYRGDRRSAAEWLTDRQRRTRWGARPDTQPRRHAARIRRDDSRLAVELDNWAAVLSEGYSYFTPEVSTNGESRIGVASGRTGADELLCYFVESEALIRRVLLAIAACNSTVVRALDSCFGGAFTGDAECRHLMIQHSLIAQRLTQEFTVDEVSCTKLEGWYARADSNGRPFAPEAKNINHLQASFTENKRLDGACVGP